MEQDNVISPEFRQLDNCIVFAPVNFKDSSEHCINKHALEEFLPCACVKTVGLHKTWVNSASSLTPARPAGAGDGPDRGPFL